MSLFGGGDSSASQNSTGSPSVSPIPSPASPDASTTRELVLSDAQIPDERTDAAESPSSISSGDARVNEITTLGSTQTKSSRPRFSGSENLWRYYASDAITLARTLDDEQANNLSIHLYNAHAWKQVLRRSSAGSVKQSLIRKSGWTQECEDGTRPWQPPTSWTAWPIEKDLAPTPSEAFWGRIDTSARQVDEALVEELRAIGLRQVKQQWTHRSEARRPSRSMGPTSPGRSRSRSRTRSVTPALGDRDDQDASSWYSDTASDIMAPVLSAQEDDTNFLLRPMANSVQSQLVKLLKALHHNRAGHYAVARDEDSWRFRADSLPRSRSSSIGRRKRGRSTSPEKADAISDTERTGRPRKRLKTGGGSKRSPSVASSASSGSGSDGEHARAPRDWSEVLGIAALCGWDAEAVNRARARCEALFNERMAFQTLVEGPEDDEEVGEEGEEDEADSYDLSPLQRVIFDPSTGYYCPYPDCARHQKVFPPAQGYRFREHLRRGHSLSDEQIRIMQQNAGVPVGRASASERNPRNWTAPDPLCCPHSGCASGSKIYPEPRRLVEHLKRYHKYDPRTQSPPPSRPQSSAGEHSDADTTSDGITMADDFMVGGVHNDGFLVPIGSKVRTRERTNRPGESP
ncbi:hypothetical protein BDZ85DRAFT_269488 [Elsinoe ampelina]|uniref:Rrn9 domain-containing protein n=1 Tax=Elsinoe ampelina TaxID=302913 RepID=A0A6A6FZR0_9PEZI|nr:hypothetical protein BDZ85DRAFT_269488 [Elsinoe ampelina]